MLCVPQMIVFCQHDQLTVGLVRNDIGSQDRDQIDSSNKLLTSRVFKLMTGQKQQMKI